MRFARLAKLSAALAVAVVSVLAHQPEAVAEDAASNGVSPVTERILSELRGGKADDDADLGAKASDAPAPRLRLDGSLDDKKPDAPNDDGKPADPKAEATQQVDGDLTADGKMIAPPEPADDPAEAAADTPQAAANARIVDGETDARTAAGRSRPIADDATPPPRPTLAGDEAAPDDADPTEPPAPPPIHQASNDTEVDPYAAVGYRRGGFLWYPSLTAETLFSDNVEQSASNPKSGIALVLRPAILIQSQWSRNALSFDLRGATTDYKDLPSDDTQELHAKLRGQLDLTKRSSLEADVAYDFNTVQRSNPTVVTGAAVLPTEHTETLGLAYNQQFDRLSLRLHGSEADTVEGDSGSGGQHYRDADLDVRASYEVSPRLTAFATAKTIERTYSDASGIDARDNEVRVGVETDHSAKLSATASIGAADITASDGSEAGAGGLVADASLTWLPSALTTVTLAGGSDLDLNNTTGVAALRTTQVSLDVKHALRRWLALLAGVSAAQHEYSGIGLSDVQRTGHIGFEYDLNREWALLGDVARTDFASNDPARSYVEDQVRLGVRLQH